MGNCCSARGTPRPSQFERIDDLIPHLETVIRRVPVLKELRTHELGRLARAMERVVYLDGEYVFEQSQVCPNFYIVLEGTAIVRIRTGVNAVFPTGATVDIDVKTMHPGDFFGESSLLLSRPRKASVVALGQLECARISRSDFDRTVGRLDTILKRNRETYNACSAMFELEPLDEGDATPGPTQCQPAAHGWRTVNDGANGATADSERSREAGVSGSNGTVPLGIPIKALLESPAGSPPSTNRKDATQ